MQLAGHGVEEVLDDREADRAGVRGQALPVVATEGSVDAVG